MYSHGPLHMTERKQGDQLEPTYSSSVRIRGVALRTFWKRWTIGRGGEKGSGISVPMARHDDDNEAISYIINYHHHLVVPSARISLTLSPHLPYRSSLPAGPQDYIRILTELLYVSSSWPPCFRSAMWRGP